jgi:hypothetical protein
MKNGNNSRDVLLMFAFSGSANLRALPKIWGFAGAVERSRNSSPSHLQKVGSEKSSLSATLISPLDVPCNAAVSMARAELLSAIGANIYAPLSKKARLGGRARIQRRMKEQTND